MIKQQTLIFCMQVSVQYDALLYYFELITWKLSTQMWTIINCSPVILLLVIIESMIWHAACKLIEAWVNSQNIIYLENNFVKHQSREKQQLELLCQAHDLADHLERHV